MEKTGIEPVTPGLQSKEPPFYDFPAINQFCPVGLRFVCWFYDGNTQTLTEIGFMEKPGIEPANPGLQGKKSFCGFPWNTPVPPGWFKICVCFKTGTPKGSPKVVLLRRRNRTCDPGLQGKQKTFCDFPGYKPVQLVCELCVGFMRGTPKGSPKMVLWRSHESNL